MLERDERVSELCIYVKPHLIVYGDLSTLTSTTQTGPNPDNGVQPNHKTGGPKVLSDPLFYDDSTDFRRRGQSGDSGERGGRQ
jgi:hypothetical protein